MLLNCGVGEIKRFLPRESLGLQGDQISQLCSDFGAKKIKSANVSTVSPSIYHEMMGPDAIILVF